MDFTTRMEIDVEQLEQLREAAVDIQLLDVREDWERALCLISGSIAIPMAALPAALDRLDPDRPVVALCHHGVRSLRVAAWLRQQGFAQAVSLAGGIDAWARQIDPAMATY
jgi:rhodanese-related sulfurtransferase